MDTHSEKDTFAMIERDHLYGIMLSAKKEFDDKVALFHILTHEENPNARKIEEERYKLALAAMRHGIVTRYCEEMLRQNARESIHKESFS